MSMPASRTDPLALNFQQLTGQQQRSTSPATSIPSPIDAVSASASARPSFGLPPPGLGGPGKMASSRTGSVSPSHDLGSSARLFPKRAREIQAQEGVAGIPVNLWAGPPTSGNSTPLRENIPESPTDGFPDFTQLPAAEGLPIPSGRRARAGTVPSRFSPGGVNNNLLNIAAMGGAVKTSRPTPSQTPFKSPSPGLDGTDTSSAGPPPSSSTLLSRLRAGSMPQRVPFGQLPTTVSPFGPSIFSSWNPTTRERGSTLASIASLGSNGPSSPTQSAFSKEGQGDSDVHMRTLDYLGLAETPNPPRATLATPYIPNMADFTRSASRFRSYSVNNKDKYADEDEEDDFGTDYASYESQYAAALQDQIAATNAAIHNHNLAVQAFASHAASRPRARTAGVLDAPGSRMLRGYFPTSSRLDSGLTAADIQLSEEKDYDDQLPQAVAGLSLGHSSGHNNNGSGVGNVNGANGLLSADEPGIEGPTSALWLGSIPTSTTTSTLTEMFKSYGPILSARVLTLKNCGFVNFERVDSAINAKASLNGKEIFPGAGPVRINFAKPPSSSNTPGHDGTFPSPSPDPFGGDGKVSSTLTSTSAGAAAGASVSGASGTAGGVSGEGDRATAGTASGAALPLLTAPAPLSEITGDIMRIVSQFGASSEDSYRISSNLQQSVQFTTFVDEIPPIPEPSNTRVYDAPKLRDIRKRIDNQSLSTAEIEQIAVEMLPEIAELASDYLGNTVVQKLFEHCSDDLRDAMLAEIAPHLAEIGVHKNGTWAAQKIIDVCKSPQQMSVIVEHIHPYTVPLFLDQYGNYVLQGCLKFGAPYNDYIFETMLSRLWEIAQGRFGARAMRACLESHHSTKDQQRMLAAAIALNSVQLATNANGALLLTWFLDTCTFPQRRTVLAPQLVPYLVHLCTHKVAYLTVLKVVNQKTEPEARDTILKALFATANDQVLEQILSDNACGATLIYKIITTPFFEESVRNQVVDSVKAVLVRIKAQPSQGYKRLMDEVGLSTRGSGGGGGGGGSGSGGNGGGSRDHSSSNEKRPSSRQANNHHNQGHPHHNAAPHQQQQSHQNHSHHSQQQQPQQQQQQQQQQQVTPPHGSQSTFNGNSGPYYSSSPNPASYEPGFGRGDNGAGVEAGLPPPPFGPYSGQGPVYGHPNQPVPPLGVQPLPYQQGLMSRGAPPMGGYYPPPPSMQTGYGTYAGGGGPPPSLDAYRNAGMPNGAGGPMPPSVLGSQQAPYISGGYGMGPAYGYAGGMPAPGPFMPEQMGAGGAGGRRGRTGRNPHRDASPRQY
ncbi:RNA-binding protein [Grosmannia clavigera kw1407]|uniref:RNA-binding protein n=1 Tax=Grosmannia clavigera (strain kw1407 / UAMH 11150) TaxID=655863 RepID=F0XPW0_GROCL|nr:RNA-binding protein [Grosmannia clavigera kw1407]EFX00102.1 RNA-binding protein [Grosmannia clavigera kw1407]